MHHMCLLFFTYHSSDKVEVLGHHVFEVVGDEDSPHVELDLIRGLSIVSVHVWRGALCVQERRERERENSKSSTLAGIHVRAYVRISTAKSIHLFSYTCGLL